MKLNLFVSVSEAGEQAVASPSHKEQRESYVPSPFTGHRSRPPWILQLVILGPKFFSNVCVHARVCAPAYARMSVCVFMHVYKPPSYV